MNNFQRWYLRNQTEITWFLIGWLTLNGFQELGEGRYLESTISFGLAYLNYMLNRR